MPFQPGNKLASGGRKDKPWSDALRLAMCGNDRKALRDLAEVVKSAALAGDMQAMKEIGDRLDGKPMQESHHTIVRTAVELSDHELADIAAGGGTDVAASPLDPSQLN